jgi:type IV pilus assembly protein PilM
VARAVVGLDIGSSGVRAVLMSRRKRAPALRRFATARLPRGAVQAGVVVDVEAVSRALRSLWAEARFPTKKVVFGIASDSVLVRQIDLDWMEPEDFRKALPYQVADVLPIPVETANLDYHVLGEFDAPGEDGTSRRMVRILLVAAARDVVDGFVQALRKAGLRPVKADLVPFALVRAVGGNGGDEGPVEAIVDLGADTLTVVVHQGGQPRFVRIVSSLGGNQITAALEAQFDWTHDDAEHFKVEFGAPVLEGIDTDAADPAYRQAVHRPLTLAHPAQQVIGERVSALVGEVATTLDFFLASSPDVSRLSRVVLTGAGSQLKGLSQRLARELQVPIEHLTPFAAVATRRGYVADAEQEKQMAVAVGLSSGVQ